MVMMAWDIKEGDAVTLIGREGERQITMEELGELSGRFNIISTGLTPPCSDPITGLKSA